MNPNKPLIRKCNPREELFCRAVVNGSTQTAAFRQIWNHPDWPDRMAAVEACKIAKRPQILARVAQLRSGLDKITYLSLNQRLGLLSKVATHPKAKPADVVRSVQVYTAIAGDGSPERHAHGGDPNGVPIVVETISEPLSRRARIEALKQTIAKK